MNTSLKVLFLAAITLAFATSYAKNANSKLSELDSIAIEAYDYGYALLMEATTAIGFVLSTESAAFNQFMHKRQFPTPEFKDVIRPNLDTLYSTAFLDLSKGPLELSIPKTTQELFYLIQIMDGWTNVIANPGARTTGHEAQKYLIVGPRFDNSSVNPSKYTGIIHCPSNLGWIIGRTLVTNGDLETAWAIQDQYLLKSATLVKGPIEDFLLPSQDDTQLAAFGGYRKAVGSIASLKPASGKQNKATPPEIVAKLSATQYFSILSLLMCRNPAVLPQDQSAIARFQRIGFRPCRPFTPSRNAARAARAAAKGAIGRYKTGQMNLGVERNGWGIIISNMGRFGTDYAFRATVAYAFIGANLPEDAVYPETRTDINGAPFQGSNSYSLVFKSGELPPVGAFWSITMYDKDGYIIDNPNSPIKRYTLSSVGSSPPLFKETDGSLQLYFQPVQPKDANKAANWIPTMQGVAFALNLRLYSPDEAILNLTWVPPRLEANTPV